MRSPDLRILLAGLLTPLLLPLGCASGRGPAGSAPMGAAVAVETVVVANEGVDLTSDRLKTLEQILEAFRTSVSGKKTLPVSEYVRAVRRAGEAKTAAELGLRLSTAWTSRRSLTLAPGEAVIVTASCFSAGSPAAAGPAANEPYRPAEAVDWIRALAVRAPGDEIRATVQGAIWNLLAGVPFGALPPDQQIIVRGAFPDAADRFPGAEGTPPTPDARAAADALTARTSSEGASPPEAIRLDGGFVVKVKHASGIERTALYLSVPPQAGESVSLDPTRLFLVSRRSDVTPLAIAGLRGLSSERFAALRAAADASMTSLAGVSIENIPWSGTPEAFYELLTGRRLGEGAPLPRFDRAVQFGLLAIEKIDEGGRAVRALRDAAKETGQDQRDVDRMARMAEGCYEFFLAIGRSRPERLPIRRSYPFGAAVREIVAFLGPGATRKGDGVYASADGAHTVSFNAEQNTLQLERGGKTKTVRIE